MNALTQAIYDRLTADATLAALLNTYGGAPAVFTTDPAPGDAELPYIVTAGDAVDASFDTKTCTGREIWRDVRCYAADDGSAIVVEQMAERVRELLHRAPLTVSGWCVFVAECSGPVVADEQGSYGRVVTVRMKMLEA